MKHLHVITGQTATGKTSRALALAKSIDGVIISADSRQIYKELDIVTGKDIGLSAKFVNVDEFDGMTVGYYELDGVQVWGYDIVSVDQSFSAHDYRKYVEYILENLIDKTKQPIIVGGTYFYIKTLLYGIETAVEPDYELRGELEQLDVDALKHRLQSVDMARLERMNDSDAHNPRRLIRAIEIASAPTVTFREVGGNTITHPDPIINSGSVRIIGLRQSTPGVVVDRVDKRIRHNALKEVQNLLNKYPSSSPGFNTIGVKQLVAHLKGEYSLEKARELWITAEIQYSKRQLSFMKQNPDIKWETV